MIEYDFSADFWTPITKGIKTATLRNMRLKPRRHARAGEPIELWATPADRRLQICRAQCVNVEGVFLHLAAGIVNVGPIERNRSTWLPLKPKARKDLALRTGHAGGWKEAAAAYGARYGEDPWAGTLISWGPREYDGPIPSREQLRDLKVLTCHDVVIPAYGKINARVTVSLVVLGWAEVTDRTMMLLSSGPRSYAPVKITDLGRWILERFEQ